MNIEDRVSLFAEQIRCCGDLYVWRYDTDMRLISSNCPKEELIDQTLHLFGNIDMLKEYAISGTKPLILNIPLGLIWCVSADRRSYEERSVYMMGPMWATDSNIGRSFQVLENVSREQNFDIARMAEIGDAIRSLPVIMPAMMYQYALIMHCSVTGDQLGLSDIIYQNEYTMSEPDEPQLRDRYRTWELERSMLRMVRKGDMGYSKVFNQASNISRGVPVENEDGLRQAKTSVIVFTSLCTRAAIEGGLSPDEAYSLGDTYIASVEKCRRISEVANFSYAMYSDFVNRVHSRRIDSSVSPGIRAVSDYVELHADEPFTNDDLARLAGYSEQYLRRKFAEEMKISLPDYIRMIRLDRAKDMLANSDLSISVIADRLQFCTRAHFSDVFAKTVGETPAKYRQRHKV